VIRYWAEYAWLAAEVGGTASGVLIEIHNGRFGAVTVGVAEPPAGATRLAGLTLPGFANAHSHAFHRALRGRTHAGKGTFWTWRERMYSLADRLAPDSYRALARATFAEMALAGITCVGEFHYLHHDHGGARYGEANAMGDALLDAAGEAGIRITLLDTAYLVSTVDGTPLQGAQLRFGDGTLDAWSSRVSALKPPPHGLIGAALHSVRALPAELLSDFAARTADTPTHVHLSEQRAENHACLARHGRTPTELLADAGLWRPGVTAVHATHLSDVDRSLLGDEGAGACFCPTTERDLADGIGPARALLDGGSPLSLGTDSHAMIDMLEEARAVELDERLRSEQRGHFAADELLWAATAAGHAALGWTDAGRIATGWRADLVTVALDTVRGAGFDPSDAAGAALFGASAADVRHVLVDGRPVVRDGVHTLVEDVPAALAAAIQAVWS
jgi:formiminoglutamate deiminase